MNKTFTHIFFNYFFKTFLVAILMCFTMVLTPDSARAVSSPYDIQIKTIRCYPNPAISFINFDIPADYVTRNYSLQIYSFTGKKMYEVNVGAAKLTLNFSNEFFRGIYIYQVRDAGGKIIETGKFQVNK